MEKLDGKNIEDILALTPMQEAMLFHYLKEPAGRHYFEQLCLHISGRIRHPLFEQAWNRVIQTNQMLRTLFRWEKIEASSQVILKQYILEPVYIDLSDQEANKKESALEEVKNRDMAQAFDLTRVPFRVILCKLSDQKYVMIVSNHHILYDGWSTGLILKEFFEAYTAVCSGDGGLPLSVKTPFKEFVKWVREQDTGSQKEYWQNYLKGIDTGTRFPMEREIGEVSPASYHLTLSKDFARQLDEFAKKNKVTASSLFYSAWGILLQKYTRGFDVLFGTTVSGRSAKVKGIEDMVGLFINTLPLRVERRAGETVVGVLRRISDTLSVREPYESTSSADITGYSPLDNKEALYDSIVILENYPLAGLLTVGNTPLKVESYTMVESAPYDLIVAITVREEIEVSFIYDEGVFDNRDIKNMSRRFLDIIRDMFIDGMTIAGIEMITPEEKNKILYEFNDTAAGYPADKTIHRLFEEQVRRTPDAVAVNGFYRTYKSYMTYNELNRRSDQPACLLKEKGVGTGTIVAIMMERTPGLLTGILGILKAGGAYLPIDPAFPEERIDFMIKDSNAKIVLDSTHPALRAPLSRGDLKDAWADSHCKSPLERALEGPRRGTPEGGGVSNLAHSPKSLAYIIYTSGSSGNPKGVLIEHAQLINFVYHMYNCFNRDFGTHDRCLSLTNVTFDVSVCEFFLPLSFGSCVVLLSDEEKSNVYDLAGIIREKEITFAYIPPGLLKELNTELRSRVSRLSLDKMLVGVEPIPDNVLEDYLLLNPSMQIINGYGPTETTICSTTYRYRSHEPEGKTVPIGRPLSNTTILLLDRDGHPVPVGVPGEICIAGAGVGRGYLNRPELTAEKFCLRRPGGFFEKRETCPLEPLKNFLLSTPLYRTGDLARWLPDGNIQFVGRIDQQVKIRGHRVELGEIENQLLRHPTIEKAVVIAGGTGNRDKYLCAYVVPGSAVSLEASRLRTYLSGRLPRYMIPSYFVQLQEIPLTPSGKVNRKALPGIEIKPGETYTAPRDDVERKLVEIWGEVLDVELSHIGMEDDFFNLGGHSLKATALISKIHKKMDIKVPLDFLFENPTVGRLARYVKKVEKDRYVSIPEAEKREYYPLSAAQKRLYITHHMEFEGLAYNVQNVVELHGTFSRVKLEETFRKLISRHESLRTSFEIVADVPVQRIHDRVEFEISNCIDNNIYNFVRPFDLSRAPLLRVGLLERDSDGAPLLVMDMHHIIADFFSMNLFIKEFIACCRGEEPPQLNLQYKDFSLWQGRTGWEEQETYWLESLKEPAPVLNLPFDYPRPAVQQFEGAAVSFEIDQKTTALLKKMALEEEVTLFMLLLAVFNVMLAGVCDREDIPVGTPVAGRRHADLQQVIGLFVNMLVLRNRPGGGKTFREFLKEVKANTLESFENQDYPYEVLVEKISAERDGGRNALFDVVFVWEGPEIELDYIPPAGTGTGGLKLIPFKLEKKNAPFDLILNAGEAGGIMHFLIIYKTSLFKEETIESLGKNFTEVLSAVVTHRTVKLEEISISHDFIAAKSQSLIEDQGDFGF